MGDGAWPHWTACYLVLGRAKARASLRCQVIPGTLRRYKYCWRPPWRRRSGMSHACVIDGASVPPSMPPTCRILAQGLKPTRIILARIFVRPVLRFWEQLMPLPEVHTTKSSSLAAWVHLCDVSCDVLDMTRARHMTSPSALPRCSAEAPSTAPGPRRTWVGIGHRASGPERPAARSGQMAHARS